jgi:hypothetical protein
VPSAPASAHKLYSGKIKHFEDREIDGRMVRAVDQAYTAGMWAKATLFGMRRGARLVQVARHLVEKAQGEGTDPPAASSCRRR